MSKKRLADLEKETDIPMTDIKKFMSKDKEEKKEPIKDDDDDKEEKEEVKKEEPKKKEKNQPKEEEKEDEEEEEVDLLAFDVDSFTTKSGKKPSTETKDVIKRFKEALKQRDEEIGKLKSSTPNKDEFEKKLKEAEEKAKKLEAKIREESFLSSDEFAETYDKPLKGKINELKDAAKEAWDVKLISESEMKDLRSALSEIQADITTSSSMVFAKALKKIDNAIDDTEVATILKNHLNEIRGLAQAKEKAEKNWEESRLSVEEEKGKRAETVNKDLVELKKEIEDEFLDSNKKLGVLFNVLEKDETFKAEDSYPLMSKVLKTFASTGKAGKNIAKLAYDAALVPKLIKAISVLDGAAASYSRENEKLKKELSNFSKMKKIENSGRFSSNDDDEEDGDDDAKSKKSGSGYALVDAIRNIKNSQ